LTDLGYAVVEAANGREAVERLATVDGIRLMFSDLVMPDTSGRDLAEQVRATYPGIRILLTSGYSEEFATSSTFGGARWPLLRKPYRLAELAEAIQAALGADAR
jgi:CheY-like chemotaxis protein